MGVVFWFGLSKGVFAEDVLNCICQVRVSGSKSTGVVSSVCRYDYRITGKDGSASGYIDFDVGAQISSFENVVSAHSGIIGSALTDGEITEQFGAPEEELNLLSLPTNAIEPCDNLDNKITLISSPNGKFVLDILGGRNVTVGQDPAENECFAYARQAYTLRVPYGTLVTPFGIYEQYLRSEHNTAVGQVVNGCPRIPAVYKEGTIQVTYNDFRLAPQVSVSESTVCENWSALEDESSDGSFYHVNFSCVGHQEGVWVPPLDPTGNDLAYVSIPLSFPTEKINALNKVGISGSGITQVQLLIGRLIKYIVGFLGTLALCLIIYSGLRFMLSQGDVEKQEGALKMMLWAGIGIVALLGAYSIASFVFGILM